jgi:tRNA (mo5U34)-methyltransferase
VNDPNSLTSTDLARRCAEYYWWHSIDFGNGVITAGQKTPEIMAVEFGNTFSPLDLNGKTVLDIGAWNGGFSLEAVRRGARSVTGLDHYSWVHPSFRGRETFDLVSRVMGANLAAIDLDLDSPALDLSGVGRFDVVLFLGVFYHLRNPLGALQQIAQLVDEVLVLESYVEQFSPERPAMMFYPGTELANDASNWWGPNETCLIELLRMAGFPRIITSPGWDHNRRVFHAYRQ